MKYQRNPNAKVGGQGRDNGAGGGNPWRGDRSGLGRGGIHPQGYTGETGFSRPPVRNIAGGGGYDSQAFNSHSFAFPNPHLEAGGGTADAHGGYHGGHGGFAPVTRMGQKYEVPAMMGQLGHLEQQMGQMGQKMNQVGQQMEQMRQLGQVEQLGQLGHQMGQLGHQMGQIGQQMG